MNKADVELLNYIKECNDIDLQQLERLNWQERVDVKKIEFLLNMIDEQREQIEKQEQIIKSFETKEMIVGE